MNRNCGYDFVGGLAVETCMQQLQQKVADEGSALLGADIDPRVQADGGSGAQGNIAQPSSHVLTLVRKIV
jgi:hypothetical protein